MQPCKCCVSGHKECQVGKDSDKCVSCVESGHQCNLVISHTEWDCVQQEQNCIHSELQTALTKTVWLQQQQELIESHWEEMIWQKFQNIKELEVNKSQKTSETAIMSSLNNFLLNVLSDQIEVLMKFNPVYWSENALFKSTSQWSLSICSDFLLVLRYFQSWNNSFTWLDSVFICWCSYALKSFQLYIDLLILWDNCQTLVLVLTLYLMLIWVVRCEI